MPVIQISRIQVRRGPKDTLPEELSDGEIMMTTDTGEVFIGAPNLEKIGYRGGSIFPYKNVRLITEFDIVHTLHDHVVTTGPLLRITSPERTDDSKVFTFKFDGDSNDPAFDPQLVTMAWSGTGDIPGDLRGRVISEVKVFTPLNGLLTVDRDCISIVHNSGVTPNSSIIVNYDETNHPQVSSYDPAQIFQVRFLNLDTIFRFPLDESDSFVMNYSLTADAVVDNLRVRRTGTLHIAADEYSVAVVDQGVDLNQSPGNYMRLVWSGHTEDIDVDGTPVKHVVLTCTNIGLYPITITFSGTRWSHAEEE